MREAAFVEQNKKKWTDFERNLKLNIVSNPDKLATQYNELSNDLAYAQTFYPNSKTQEYLNELAIYAHQSIYKDRKNSSNQLANLFKYDVPNAVYKIRKPLFYSLLIFTLASVIGWISSVYDDSFVRFVLSDGYVDETIERIKDGNPAGIYGESGEVGSFLGITINNIKVAFYAFVLGIFFSVGSGYILFSNGIMVGAFHYMFHKYGVLPEAMSAIWIHGAFELSVIVIAGGCGIAIGNSFMFPKTLKRMDSFKQTTKTASIVLLSTIPFFIVAGFLEGFVTRHYQVNIFLSLSIILVCLSIIVFYYVLYPILIHKKTPWKN
ncbi:MAG: stage II sporulation protein M [Flavobacteriales bacterium]|nr:stage II sporulation protein M [Flavobacteriales bacterium]